MDNLIRKNSNSTEEIIDPLLEMIDYIESIEKLQEEALNDYVEQLRNIIAEIEKLL